MREYFGRALCAALGAGYMAGAAPLFNFGERGKQIYAFIESMVAPIAESIGVSSWVAMSMLGPFAVGGPLALVWLIAGKGISRIFWFFAGIVAYGAYWWYF